MPAPSPAALPAGRPRLVFFQWDHSPYTRYAKYMMQHARDHVRCLEQFFDVVVINEDCDFGRICDQHQPDLALFEVGYQSNVSHRIEIANTAAHPQVPRAALLNADSWAWTRSGALSDMDHWGIGTCFSICTTVHDYMPDTLDNLFTWPNFIDPAVFRDYGLEKTIPVMLTGSQVELYPWRQRISPVLSQSYPCLISPPHNYADAGAARALAGERYARALNACLFAPSCGTMAREIVRKHFEIPGSGACLIAERTPMAEAAGFRHMKNCVFADAQDVLDSLDALMADPERLRRITAAGYNLVHSRHTMAQRAQIRQWFDLTKTLPPGRRIEQRGPFADLTITDPSRPGVAFPTGGGIDRGLLAQAYAGLLHNDISKARARFTDCLGYVADLPDPLFGLALCDIACGDPAAAAQRLGRLIETTTVVYGAPDPDPVEWAFYLYALATLGRDREARRLSDWYPRLSHPALDRVRHLLSLPGPDAACPPRRPSIHDRFMPVPGEWGGLLQPFPDLAARRVPEIARAALSTLPGPRRIQGPLASATLARGMEFVLVKTNFTGLRPNVPPTRELDYPGNIARRLRRLVRKNALWHRAADFRRYLKARRERREVYRHLRAMRRD